MALKVLVALSLLAALVQVRAQMCFSGSCGTNGRSANSIEECCLGDPLPNNSYYQAAGGECHPCIVIGFTPVIVTIPEESGDYHTTQIRLLTDPDSLDDDYKDAKIELTVEVFTGMSNAAFGEDFTIQHWSQSSTTTTSFVLRNLTFDINIMAINDEDLVETEEFRLIVTAQFMNGSLGDIAVANSARVIIEDDDVIVIGFTRSETEADESDGEVELPLRVTRGLNLPTYFCVHALTYTNYSNHHEEWRTKYPNLPADSLSDEKDEAEWEDFTTKENCFTVEPSFQGKIDYVKINLTNDDKVEPVHEGFRVLLAVDESQMPISHVSFEGLEQLALIRIDDYNDEITIGFSEERINVKVESEDTIDRDLHFDIISGSTEFPINLTVTVDGEKSNATPGYDYLPETINFKETVKPPNTIVMDSVALAVITHLDDTFDDDRTIVLEMDSEDLKQHVKPFKPGNTITVPTNRVNLDPDTLTIVIQDSVKVFLIVPDIVNEGEEFSPMVRVSQPVDISFIVSVESGTAEVGRDFDTFSEMVTLSSSQTQAITSIPIQTHMDNLVELNETFKVTIEFLGPSDLRNRVIFDNEFAPVNISNLNPAKIGFKLTNNQVNESDREVNLTVEVTGDDLAPGVLVSVMLNTSSDTANDLDFVPVSSQILGFNSDVTEHTVSIKIVDDGLTEDLETFKAHLAVHSTNVDNAIVDPADANIDILDNNYVDIGFDPVSYMIDESAGLVELTIRVLRGNLAKNVEVTVETDDHGSGGDISGSAMDLIPISQQTIVFSDNMPQVVHVTITQDMKLELDENFFVKLSSSDTAVFLNPSQAQVTILNDDVVVIGFDRMEYTAFERDGFVDITLRINNNVTISSSSDPVEVQFQSAEDTATIASDYSCNPLPSYTFTATDTQFTVRCTFVDDDVSEDLEMFNIRLTTTSLNVTLLPRNAVVKIYDDDKVAFSFDREIYMVDESEGNVTIFVTKNGSSNSSRNVTFTSQVEGRPDISFDMEFSHNEFTKSYAVPVYDDDVALEDLARYALTLQIPSYETGAILGKYPNATYEVADDDVLVLELSAPDLVVEDSGDIIVNIAVDKDVATALELNVFALPNMTAGSAQEGEDYAFNGSVMLIPGAHSDKELIIEIIDDRWFEQYRETFEIQMVVVNQPSFAMVDLENDDENILIQDNDEPEIGFVNETYDVVEGEHLTFKVEIKNDVMTAIPIHLVVTDVEGEAHRMMDYIGLGTLPLTIEAGQTDVQGSVDIVDDDVTEVDEETFMLNLTAEAPRVSVSTKYASAEVEIMDDDDMITVGFKKDQYTYNESMGDASVEVVLTGNPAEDVTVLVQGGPASQDAIGTDRLEFDETITFTPDGPKQIPVLKEVQNDAIALEADEMITVQLSIINSHGLDVTIGPISSTTVTILDDDVLRATFSNSTVLEVLENVGTFQICVLKNLQTISDVTFDIRARNGTAIDGVDYTLPQPTVTIPKDSLQQCFSVEIKQDDQFEDEENFYVDLSYSGTGNVQVIMPSSIEITILNDDDLPVPQTVVCTLTDTLTLHTFSNSDVSGHSYSTSEGCEHKLVTSCNNDELDLEIRMDFMKNNFSSTKVSIYYEGLTVRINEDLSLDPPTANNTSKFVYSSSADMVSVSIPGVMDITRNLTALTIISNSNVSLLTGLCGHTNGSFYLSDCTTPVNPGQSLDSFKHAYKVKPSDQILRGEREECGITDEGTVIGDPLMTVPIYDPDYGSNLHLCYEIHGAAGQYFNLVSDGCTSVNAHYAQAPGASFLNIIDSMGFVVIDNEEICHKIEVDAANCTATVDGITLLPIPQKKKSTTQSRFDVNGVSVRSYNDCVRISVPNCADNSLVMWAFCQHQSIPDPFNETNVIGPIDMIKFEITRGLNLKETSHGLIGQFWNIPVEIEAYNGGLNFDDSSTSHYYNITVTPPEKDPRSFVGFYYELSWEFERKQCFYVGDRQGGPSGEPNFPEDSVIEGSYQDYITADAFGTSFNYNAFTHDDAC